MENLFHAASVPASQLERYDLKGHLLDIP